MLSLRNVNVMKDVFTCWQDEWVPQSLDEEMESVSNADDESDDNEDINAADQKQKSTETMMDRDSESDSEDNG